MIVPGASSLSRDGVEALCVYICVCMSLVKKGEELRSTELHSARKDGEKKLRGKSNPVARIVPP